MILSATIGTVESLDNTGTYWKVIDGINIGRIYLRKTVFNPFNKSCGSGWGCQEDQWIFQNRYICPSGYVLQNSYCQRLVPTGTIPDDKLGVPGSSSGNGSSTNGSIFGNLSNSNLLLYGAIALGAYLLLKGN